MQLVNIGFGNMISAERMIAIVSPESAPIKRIIQDAKDRGTLIDATYGRRTRAVLVTDSDHVILSAGMRPRQDLAESFRNTAPFFVVIGDASKPSNVRNATRTGYDAALRL